MVERKRRKKNKVRGNRTHGGGNKKNRRGSGCRGGVGRGGSRKHKKASYQDTFGLKIRLNSKPTVKGINFDDLQKEIDNLKKGNKLNSENGLVVVDGQELGYKKLLSRGNLRDKVLIKNMSLSKRALEKLQSFGSELVDTELEVEETEA